MEARFTFLWQEYFMQMEINHLNDDDDDDDDDDDEYSIIFRI